MSHRTTAVNGRFSPSGTTPPFWAIYVILCLFSGCSAPAHLTKSPSVDDTPLSAWAIQVIKQIEACHMAHKRQSELYMAAAMAYDRLGQFKGNQADRSIAMEYGMAKARLARGILNLWWMTGHCLYSDIRYDDLDKHAEVILGRYADFTSTNGRRDHHEVIIGGFRNTVDMMQTDYAWHAMMFIHERCLINPGFLSTTDKFTHVVFSVDKKRQHYKAFLDWHKSNYYNITWNPIFRKFTQQNGLSFEVVIEDDTDL